MKSNQVNSIDTKESVDTTEKIYIINDIYHVLTTNTTDDIPRVFTSNLECEGYCYEHGLTIKRICISCGHKIYLVHGHALHNELWKNNMIHYEELRS